MFGALERHGPGGRSRVRVRPITVNRSLLKRSIRGTYVSVEPFHLFRYLDEEAFRFNSRKVTDGERFKAATRRVFGKRLTYAE